MSYAITSVNAWTAAGRGLQPLIEALQDGRTCFSKTPPYPADGLRTASVGRVAGLDREQPATHLLKGVTESLDLCGARIGWVVGTSSGDLCGPWERWHRATLNDAPTEDGEPSRDGPIRDLVHTLGHTGPIAVVSVACISGTAAFSVAMGWLDDDRCDQVVVAGVDALSLFIHAGFSGLGALSDTLPQPFAIKRDGLLLGEGAAALVLERAEYAEERGVKALAYLCGSGLSSDATHLTAPNREGRGVIRALQQALGAIAPERVNQISVHGTGTRFNDAMEAKALHAVFGPKPRAIHGVKHCIGHTLGAAGAIEAAVITHCLARGLQLPPPSASDPDCPLPPAPRHPPAPTLAISTSSAFGGANAAILIGKMPTPRPSPRPVHTSEPVHFSSDQPIDWKQQWPNAPERFWRLDAYSRAALWAVHLLSQKHALQQNDLGLILASPSGCRLADLRYHRRLVQRGAALASRRDFTYTIPGAPIAELSIQHGWTGPSLAFVGPPEQALDEAQRLIRYSRADRLISVGIEAAEPGGAVSVCVHLLQHLEHHP